MLMLCHGQAQQNLVVLVIGSMMIRLLIGSVR